MTRSIVPVPGKKKRHARADLASGGRRQHAATAIRNGLEPAAGCGTTLAAGCAPSVSSARTALIVGFLALIVLVIFIIQNADAVKISFLGVQVRISLAVALLIAVIAGALVMAAAGTARITQLRMVMRRDRRQPPQA